MALINSRVLFVTTSPRTPFKIIPEIELLSTHFSGQVWNSATQAQFMALLSTEDCFDGQGKNNPAFSARDRINRTPKSLGFIKLKPNIALTPAGIELIHAKRKEEIFLRQLLKFQLPSPYHILGKEAAAFRIKPYLELFRLIRHLGSVSFDEIMMFGLQMVDYLGFNEIVEKIELFRIRKAQNHISYKTFRNDYFEKELKNIYRQEISKGQIQTRESHDDSTEKFIRTKAKNMRDYTDACFRYLRATGLVNISHIGKSISIMPEKRPEVDYFLDNIDPCPCFVNNLMQYEDYLSNIELPRLLADDRVLLSDRLRDEFPELIFDPNGSILLLKELLYDKINERKSDIINKQVAKMKDYRLYSDIVATFNQIEDKVLYDAPLMLEWNMWRALTMIDGGKIKANLKFDDFGNPMSTATGNMADIVCDYCDFSVTVEVTMQSGQRQYETEGEPVARHLAKYKKESNKPTYCLFVAPKINDACIAHFYILQKTRISYYEGVSIIIPLPLSIFRKMLDDSHKASYVPNSGQVKRFFEKSNELALNCVDEKDWYNQITTSALNWLSI